MDLEREIETKNELLEQRSLETSSLRRECAKLQKKVVSLKAEYETLYKVASQELENLRSEMLSRIDREREEDEVSSILKNPGGGRGNDTNITFTTPVPLAGS